MSDRSRRGKRKLTTTRYRTFIVREVPEELYLKFRTICIMENKSMKSVYLDFVKSYVKDKGKAYNITEKDLKKTKKEIATVDQRLLDSEPVVHEEIPEEVLPVGHYFGDEEDFLDSGAEMVVEQSDDTEAEYQEEEE